MGVAVVVEAARARAERSVVKNIIVVAGMSVRGGRKGVEWSGVKKWGRKG
jgi:hypothetical protein